MKRPIITLEDGTEVLETTGDVDAFEHGGGVLFRAPHRRGTFWTFWSSRELGEKSYRVFTAPIPPDVIEHFEPDLKELTFVSGIDLREMRKLSRSKNPVERLHLVMAIRDCNGASRVDPEHEPEIMSIHELSERWGAVFGIDAGEIPMVDYEDFIIRETPFRDYECGSVDGKYLGRYQEYKHALCAIADCMKEWGRDNSNVFHEHEREKLELVAWERDTFVGKIPKRRGKLPEARWRNSMKRYATSEIRRKGIDKKAEAQRSVTRERSRAKARIAQRDRIQRARDMRRSMEEIYGS